MDAPLYVVVPWENERSTRVRTCRDNRRLAGRATGLSERPTAAAIDQCVSCAGSGLSSASAVNPGRQGGAMSLRKSLATVAVVTAVSAGSLTLGVRALYGQMPGFK